MTETNPPNYNEIDLFELFEMLWDGKWKIIATTFIAAVIGVGFSVLKPSSYEVSSSIQSGKQSVFVQYTSLNNLLQDNGLLYNAEENPNGFIFNSASIFKMFISEFNDYEEMVDAVSTSEFVQKTIKDLDYDGKQRALISFAKAFKLEALSKNEEIATLAFEWHDELEGMRLLNDAIRQTLSNIKNTSVSNIKDLADAIDNQNTRNINNLRNKISVIKENQINKKKNRIQYLLEQATIARELGIETNRLDANTLSQTSRNLSLSINTFEIPYYLRGYKAIDKEISIIENRSDELTLLNADGYLETIEELLSLEIDLSSSQLRNASEVIANDNPNDWVEFNFGLADVKSQKRSSVYVALSIALGGIVGVMYVLISNVVRKRKEQLVKV